MNRALMALFGVRITVIYKNGAKATFRARKFDFYIGDDGRHAEWKRPILSWSRSPLWLNVDEIYAPILSWSRSPLWLNVDEIYAIWQGKH